MAVVSAPPGALFSFRVAISRRWLLLPMTGFATAIICCLLYLGYSQEALTDWYNELNPCFYKAWEWPKAFFTPAVKNTGNYYCIAGILLSVALLGYTIWKRSKIKSPYIRTVSLMRIDAVYLGVLYLFGLAIWLYGLVRCVPGYDEVFSAINCAGIHPFQTASYYMLPNNHVFFNLLNAIVGAPFSDKLASGRVISGLSMAVLIPILYFWLKSKTGARLYAAVFCAVMLLQFPVWGFSFQGRGYSIYLLFAWISFIALQRFFESGSRAALLCHAMAVVLGFWTVPSFLFWEAALGIYLVIHIIQTRRIPWPAVRAQLFALAGVFLVYLPLLCFSGLAAILDNRYVRADKVSLKAYWPTFRMSFRSTIQYCFSGFVDAHNWSYIILFFLPLALLPFIRRSRVAGSVAFYITVWLSFCVLELYMQRFPFMRNLIAHYSITLAALLLACQAILKEIMRSRVKNIQSVAVVLACAALSIHFMRFNRDHIYDSLYFYNSDSRYQDLHKAVMWLPADARVGLSDEGFYWEYLCHRRGLEASMCLENPTHCIKMETEEFPIYLRGRMAEKVYQAQEYEIYLMK